MKTVAGQDVPVLLVELSARLGGHEIAPDDPRVRDHVVEDWAGRWTVPSAIARRLVEDYESARARAEEMRAAHQNYLARFRAIRDELVGALGAASFEAARQVAEAQARASGAGFVNEHSIQIASRNPGVRSCSREALAEVLAAFDADHRALDLAQFEARGGRVELPRPDVDALARRAAEAAASKYRALQGKRLI